MIFDIATACPLGLNIAAMERALKQSFGLAVRPRIVAVGQFDLAKRVYVEGTGTVYTDKTEATPMPWSGAQRDQALTVLATSTPNNGGGKIKLADLEQLQEEIEKGDVFYVADLPRETSGTGAHAYWTGNSWRKLSNDALVPLP